MIQLREAEDSGRIRYILDGSHQEVGYLTFTIAPDQIAIAEHTVVDPSCQGLGFAGDLAAAFFDYCIESGLRVRPICPYIVTYLRRHPELQDMVVE